MIDRGLAREYPRNGMIISAGFDSYAGMPLFDSAGAPLGIIAVLRRRPLDDGGHVSALLGICSMRAAAELERLRSRGGAARQRGAVPRDLQRSRRRDGAARRRFPHRRRQPGLRASAGECGATGARSRPRSRCRSSARRRNSAPSTAASLAGERAYRAPRARASTDGPCTPSCGRADPAPRRAARALHRARHHRAQAGRGRAARERGAVPRHLQRTGRRADAVEQPPAARGRQSRPTRRYSASRARRSSGAASRVCRIPRSTCAPRLDMVRRALAGETCRAEMEALRKDGQRYHHRGARHPVPASAASRTCCRSCAMSPSASAPRRLCAPAKSSTARSSALPPTGCC